jgi:hypothetical protein
VMSRRKYSKHSDVWSFGVATWEIFSFGILPYMEYVDNPSVITFVTDGGTLSKPKYCPQKIWDVAFTCFQSPPSKRPPFPELVESISSALSPSTSISVIYE